MVKQQEEQLLEARRQSEWESQQMALKAKKAELVAAEMSLHQVHLTEQQLSQQDKEA